MEIWWDGVAATRIIFNIRAEYEKLNRSLPTTAINDEFTNLQATLGNDERFEITHKIFADFSLKISYGGRSTFGVTAPHNWKTSGLVGSFNLSGGCRSQFFALSRQQQRCFGR